MSKDAAMAFLKMASEDPGLQKKILELAKAEGYEYSVEELSEEELDQAAGGLTTDIKWSASTISFKFIQPYLGDTIIRP